jgi:hypothetical protein
MRKWIVMGAAGLAGCAADTIPDSSRPTISFDLDNRGKFERAAERAETWCRENFDRRSRLVSDTDYNDADMRVTFECLGE